MAIKAAYQHIISQDTLDNIGKVGVLYGGISDERQVSLWSGEAVYNALIAAGVDAVLIDVKADFLEVIGNYDIDWAFPVLHGRGGEDGTIQAVLEWLNIPYVGSGVRASAIAMDKIKTKQIWWANGLPVLPQMLLEKGFDVDTVIETVGLPMAVKPVLEGSSNGISKVTTAAELQSAFEKADQHSSAVMAERWIEGKEYTGAIIGEQVLPLIQICIAEGGLYDFETKYITGASEYRCPSDLSAKDEKQLQQLIQAAAKTLDIADWARVDIMVDDDGQPWLIEINTIPGMTETSLVPKSAKVAGLDFSETVLTLLNTSWEGYQHA